MIKYLISLILFFTYIQAQTINFNESKYISALELTTQKVGTIDFSQDYLQVTYKQEAKTLTFFEDIIIQDTKNSKEELSYEDNLGLEIFYKLIKAIYSNKFDDIKEYFEISYEKNLTILTPDDYIGSVIEKIEFRKNKEFLEHLEISFTNEDRINIVQTK